MPLHSGTILHLAFVYIVYLRHHCDEWGGAESRGSRARPVEFNDNERQLRNSLVSSPTEELRKDKGGVTTVEDERGPGLGFILCFHLCFMRQSSVRGSDNGQVPLIIPPSLPS